MEKVKCFVCFVGPRAWSRHDGRRGWSVSGGRRPTTSPAHVQPTAHVQPAADGLGLRHGNEAVHWMYTNTARYLHVLGLQRNSEGMQIKIQYVNRRAKQNEWIDWHSTERNASSGVLRKLFMILNGKSVCVALQEWCGNYFSLNSPFSNVLWI